MSHILAYNFPERQFKEMLSAIKPILNKEGIEYRTMWPHITIAHLPEVKKEWKQALLDMAHENIDTFKIDKVELFKGRKTPRSYLVVSLIPSKKFQDLTKKVQEVSNIDLRNHTPHVSIVNVPNDDYDNLKHVMDQIQEAIAPKLYAFKPTNAQIWSDYEVTEVKGYAIVEAKVKKYSHIDFKPPKSVADEAKKGLEYLKVQKAGTPVGWARARQLKNRENLSPETLKRMLNFFTRHEHNKKAPSVKDDNPPHEISKWRVAWLLWGGDSGYSWARKVNKQMEAADKKDKKKTKGEALERALSRVALLDLDEGFFEDRIQQVRRFTHDFNNTANVMMFKKLMSPKEYDEIHNCLKKLRSKLEEGLKK